MMFNDKPVAIGRNSGDGRMGVLQWVADGGQYYPPKIGTRCEVIVSSPYTGRPDGEFIATVAHCDVHSAGIDRTISDVTLRLKGVVKR